MLELVDVSRRFGDAVALDGLSMTVEEGQLLGFVGPNGAGKTTAMRIVLGVLTADSGQVLWRGRPIDAATRRRFGYMPEERGLYPTARVDEQLAYFARLHGLEPRESTMAAERWIERLGLSGRSRDRVEKLSLGNQQRVQLAAALVHEPELLILDEPFAGLDPVGVDNLAELLVERSAAGIPVVFSSHQLELVERLCEAVVIINHGRLVAAGSVDELRARGRRTLRLRVEAPSTWWRALEGVEQVDGSDAGELRLSLGDGVDDQQVLDAARRAGRVTDFGFEERSLSELFREAMADPETPG